MLTKSVMNKTPELKRLARAADDSFRALGAAVAASPLRNRFRMFDAIERGDKLPDEVNAAFNRHHRDVQAYWRARGVI